MKLGKWFAALFCFMVALPPTVWARTVTVTITGTVSSGTNGYSGTAYVFGSGTNLAGLSYSLTYTFDESKGQESGGRCSSDNSLYTSTISDSPGSNPGTAVLTITDASLHDWSYQFGGASIGGPPTNAITGTTSSARLYYGPVCYGYSFGQYAVNVTYGANGYSGSGVVSADVYPAAWPSGNISSTGDWRNSVTLASLKTAYTFTFTINVTSGGSQYQYASGTLTPTYLSVSGFYDVPDSETTNAEYSPWGTGSLASTAKWYQTLNQANSNSTIGFTGTSNIREQASGSTTDTCYAHAVTNTGSSLFPAVSNAATGGTWSVDSTNVWKDDTVGYVNALNGSVYLVPYYQANGSPFNCGYTGYQQMQYLDLSGTWRNYGSTNTGSVNELQGLIDSANVYSTRAGQTIFRTFP